MHRGRTRSSLLCQGATVRLRLWALLVPLVLGMLAIAVAAYSLVHAQLYRVSLFSPEALPERVQVCGRHFAAAGDTVVTTRHKVDAAAPGREPLTQVGTFDPPLHRRMEVLGRPTESVCGMEVFVGDDDHLTGYTLMGGP